ncbi:MAG: HEAT repeat domain-containing protein [bacterium]|nr:HEAT repeat domain-containing protein [bacterium]
MNEPHAGVQAAALRQLADPEDLDQPELVVDHFGSLLPDAYAAARPWAPRLVTLAEARIRSRETKGRLPAFRAVAALAELEGVNALQLGLEDPMPEIRDAAFEGIEQRVARLAFELRSGDTKELARDATDRAVWDAFHHCLTRYPEHGRESVLDLLPLFGARAVRSIVRLAATAGAAGEVGPIEEALVRSPEGGVVDLALALAAHRSVAMQRLGQAVLRRRTDDGFQVAMAERIVELAESHLLGLDNEFFGEALREAAPRIDTQVALDLLPAVVEQAPNPGEGQNRAEAFLWHPANPVQVGAIDQLAGLGCPNGFDAVGQVLMSAADEVRIAAARLVINLQPDNAAELLTPLLGSTDAEARRLAIQEVSRVSLTRFLDRFDGMDDRAREIAARALAKIDAELLDRLASEFESLNGSRRIAAIRTVQLLDAGEDLREPLLEMLTDNDVRVRATAVRIVQLSGSVDGVRILIEALSDDDRRVRANAIEAFEELDDCRHAELLLPFLRDRDNRVRANAAKALWNLGWPDAREALVQMLGDSQSRMRISAIWAIEQLAFHGAREVLRARDAAERDPAVRARLRAAIVAVGQSTTASDAGPVANGASKDGRR